MANCRYWLLTWTTYGSWLPGDRRGFIGKLRQPNGSRHLHNQPGQKIPGNLPALENFAANLRRKPAVFLTAREAEILLEQFHETAQFKHYRLLAAAVLSDHVHLVVQTAGDPDPAELLRTFKSYATRRLGPTSGQPWWARSGSRRILKDEPAIRSAVRYVRQQKGALAVWADPAWM